MKSIRCRLSYATWCEHFKSGECTSPVKCNYQTEHISVKFPETIFMPTKEAWEKMQAENLRLTAEVARLTAENAELRAQLEKAEFPVKLGDVVFFIPTRNGNPKWGVCEGFVQMIGITRRGIRIKIRDMSDFGKTYMLGKSVFTDRDEAEARLKELQGEER